MTKARVARDLFAVGVSVGVGMPLMSAGVSTGWAFTASVAAAVCALVALDAWLARR